MLTSITFLVYFAKVVCCNLLFSIIFQSYDFVYEMIEMHEMGLK